MEKKVLALLWEGFWKGWQVFVGGYGGYLLGRWMWRLLTTGEMLKMGYGDALIVLMLVGLRFWGFWSVGVAAIKALLLQQIEGRILLSSIWRGDWKEEDDGGR